MKLRSTVPIILAAAALAAPATAATTISFTSGGSISSGYAGTGEALTFSGGGVSARVTAWSANNRGVISPGQLGVWSAGIGVRNTGGDNSHTIDNSGWTDFLLLQFDNPVRLENARFNTGWHSMSDTDATIGYGIVSLSQIASLQGQTWPIPWLETFSSGAVGTSGNSTRNINPQGFSGNTWLIGASFSNPDRKLDGFKLQSIAVNSAVPEPGTWLTLLFGFALLGSAMRYRRRQQPQTSFSF